MLQPVEVREGNKFIGVYPGSGYRIEYTIDFPAPIGRQKACIDLAAETYGSAIAAARTFGYKADEKRLRDMGLIRGAGPENAIILGARGPENGPLRFTDEYVRHKVLDLIGDLALAGRRIEGHVVAERAGHAMHTALVSRLHQRPLRLGTGACLGAESEPAEDSAFQSLASRLALHRRSRGCRPGSVTVSHKQNPHRRLRGKALSFLGKIARLRVTRKYSDQV